MVYLGIGNNAIEVWSKDQEWQKIGIESSEESMGRFNDSLQRFDFYPECNGEFPKWFSPKKDIARVLEITLSYQSVE